MPTFFLTNGNDTFPGGQPHWINTGEDVVHGLDGDDTIDGGAFNDVLNGNNGVDDLFGGVGDDALNGGADNDDLFGGADGDTLSGNEGNDTLDGEGGNDTLKGGAGNDASFGRDGNDTFDDAGGGVGATDVDTHFGDAGDDILVTAPIEGTAAAVSFDGGSGTDTVAAFGSLIGYTFSNV
jgi:Ca2+-binding RTX toxin-like protein